MVLWSSGIERPFKEYVKKKTFFFVSTYSTLGPMENQRIWYSRCCTTLVVLIARIFEFQEQKKTFFCVSTYSTLGPTENQRIWYSRRCTTLVVLIARIFEFQDVQHHGCCCY